MLEPYDECRRQIMEAIEKYDLWRKVRDGFYTRYKPNDLGGR